MGNDLTKRLMWSGLLAGVGALSTIVATRRPEVTTAPISSRLNPASTQNGRIIGSSAATVALRSTAVGMTICRRA